MNRNTGQRSRQPQGTPIGGRFAPEHDGGPANSLEVDGLASTYGGPATSLEVDATEQYTGEDDPAADIPLSEIPSALRPYGWHYNVFIERGSSGELWVGLDDDDNYYDVDVKILGKALKGAGYATELDEEAGQYRILGRISHPVPDVSLNLQSRIADLAETTQYAEKVAQLYLPNVNLGSFGTGLDGNYQKSRCSQVAKTTERYMGLTDAYFDWDSSWPSYPAEFGFTVPASTTSSSERQPLTIRGKTTAEAEAYACAFAVGSMLSTKTRTNPYREVFPVVEGRGRKADLAKAVAEAKRQGLDVQFDVGGYGNMLVSNEHGLKYLLSGSMNTRQKQMMVEHLVIGMDYDVDAPK